MPAQLVVIGSYNRDLGMALDRFPQPGESLAGRDFLETPGGKGSNQAIQAARCGVPTAIVAAVGADAGGDAARALWTAEGIDVGGVVTHDRHATGVAMILVDRAGQNQVAFALGANLALDTGDIERAAPTITGARLIAGQLETPIGTTLHAFQIARRAGVATLLNPSPTPTVLPDALWDATDILIANEIEGPQLAGLAPSADPRDIGAALLARVRTAVVLTIGPAGAWLFAHGAAPRHRPALPVAAIDTTGAGDAFLGGFSAQWLATRDLNAALDWGSAAGGLACTRRGVVPSLSQRAEIARAAKEGYGA